MQAADYVGPKILFDLSLGRREDRCFIYQTGSRPQGGHGIRSSRLGYARDYKTYSHNTRVGAGITAPTIFLFAKDRLEGLTKRFAVICGESSQLS